MNDSAEKTTLEKPTLNDSVFHAYLMGNGTIPQTALGIGIYTLGTIFDKDIPVSEILTSEVSPAQIEKALTAMTSYHKKPAIPYTKENVSHERIKPLVAIGQYAMVYAALLGNKIINNHMLDKDVEDRILVNLSSDETINYVDNFYTSPAGIAVKKMLIAGISYLKSSETKEITSEYRKGVLEWNEYKKNDYKGNVPESSPTDILYAIRYNLQNHMMGVLDQEDKNIEAYENFAQKFLLSIGTTAIDNLPEDFPKH
jgi:hypothetical protein